jgi:hypothetical protein
MITMIEQSREEDEKRRELALYSGGPGSLYLDGRLQDENREASTAVTAPWNILGALAQHVSRYDDAGPDRMGRPDQQNHSTT